MKSLEIITSQDSGFTKDSKKRFELIEELVRIDNQREEVQAKDLALPVPLRVRDYQEF